MSRKETPEKDRFWTVVGWGLVVLLLLFLVGLALGCSSQQVATAKSLVTSGAVTDKPGLRQAQALIWDAYGRKDEPPRVRIVEGDELSCTDPNSGNPGFPVLLPDERRHGRYVEACREGFTYLPSEVMVAWRPGVPWSRTSLAHEDQHAKQAREGVIDPQHHRPEWQPGGDVDQANARLAEKGL